MPEDLDPLSKWYSAWSKTASDLHSDLNSIEKGNCIAYNVDYSILYSYVWGRPELNLSANGQSKWDNACRMVCQDLLRNQIPVGTAFVLTSPSFIEAIEGIQRHLSQETGTEEYYTDLYTTTSAELEAVEKSLGDLLSSDLMTRHQLESRLERIMRKVGFNSSNVVNRLRSFVRSGGPFVGLREIAPTIDLDSLTSRFNELFEQMERTRGRSPKETRTPENRRLHYKIDCANIVLCEAISKIENGNTEFGFVTKVSNKKDLVGDYGRTSLMVLALLRLNRHSAFPELGDKIEHLTWMKQDADRIILGLKRRSDRRGNLRDGDPLLEQLSTFDQKYIKSIYSSKSLGLDDLHESLAKLKDISSTSDQLRDHIGSAKASVSSDLQTIINEHPDVLNDELLATFDISGEPVVRNLLGG
jgi:hypothetical protein